jgi:ATP-binding cassette subfamily G (WHITE) protein 2 (PDR)
MGFKRPPVSISTADFLTALTHPPEASLMIRPGFEYKVPRTLDDFIERWHSSPERQQLLSEVAHYEHENPIGGPSGQLHMHLLRGIRNGQDEQNR